MFHSLFMGHCTTYVLQIIFDYKQQKYYLPLCIFIIPSLDFVIMTQIKKYIFPQNTQETKQNIFLKVQLLPIYNSKQNLKIYIW